MKKSIIILAGFLLTLVIIGTCDAQPNTRTRQIRFGTGVQFASDTAATADNAGRIWYDFETERFRKNENGSNGFLSGGSAYTASNGINITANDIRLGGYLMLDSTSLFISPSFEGYKKFIIGTPDYYSPEFGQIFRHYYSALDLAGEMSFMTNAAGVKRGFILGNDLSDSYIKLYNLPTVSPCASYGTGTLWNDAGTLKICP